MPEVWGEAYGPGVHDELAQRNVHTYANFIREWLTAPEVNVPALMQQLFSDPGAREFYKRGMSVAYTANHDDEMGHYLPKEGAIATILCSLPVSKVMLAQGQRHGDTRRYGADTHAPMEDYKRSIADARQRDPGFAAHMDSLTPLIDCDVFRSPDSEWSPAYIQSMNNRDLHKIFHIVRTHGDDRVLTVVDCEPPTPNAEITVNLSVSFGVPEAELDNYSLVNMLSGEVLPAKKMLSLRPDPRGPGFSSYMFGLVEKDRLAAKLAV